LVSQLHTINQQVELLGGFAIFIGKTDFWVVTVILVSEGTRIFSRSHELEWQHQSTWTLAHAEPKSFRLIRSGSRYLWRVITALFNPFSALKTEHERDRQIKENAAEAQEFQKKLIRSVYSSRRLIVFQQFQLNT
jgi:hypothetical protein